MHIADVIHRKGGEVHSISMTQPLEVAAQLLWQKQIGALVVRDRQGELGGILSERDIVHAVAEHGPAVLRQPVRDFMTPEVITCRPEDRIDGVLQVMTVHRVRHIPVRVAAAADEGVRLVGVVSIGDLVKHRLSEKAQEVEILRGQLNLTTTKARF